jgi:predicted hydrolase (HD superfamily)
MIQTIHIGHLLRETVASPYRNLVTRPTGAAIRNRIQETLAGSDCLTALLDFSGIELLDFSCADEVVAKLLLRVAVEDEHYVVLTGITDLHLDALDHVLERHGLSVAALADGDAAPRVLGVAPPDAVTAFQTVQRLGPGDAKRLADALGWTVERAADALQSLALRRLIQAAGGTYRPLSLS